MTGMIQLLSSIKLVKYSQSKLIKLFLLKIRKRSTLKKKELSQIEEIGYGKIECEDFNEAFQNLEI